MLALGYFTFRDLLHDRWRSLLTILSLAVVVVGYLLLASLAQAMVILSRQAKVTNNLLILAADTIDPMDSSIDEDVLQIAREIAPGQIRLAFPILFRHLTIDGKLMQVRSVALEEMSTSVGLTLVQGDWPDSIRQVVVSEGAAELASWKIGSTVNIYGTDFQVTGLVRTEENAFGSVWMTYHRRPPPFWDLTRLSRSATCPLSPRRIPKVCVPGCWPTHASLLLTLSISNMHSPIAITSPIPIC